MNSLFFYNIHTHTDSTITDLEAPERSPVHAHVTRHVLAFPDS